MGVKVNWRASKQAYYADINHLGKRAGVPFTVKVYGTDKKAEAAANAFAVKTRAAMKDGKYKLDKADARIPLQKLAEETLALQGDRKDATMTVYRRMAKNHIYTSKLARMLITAITDHEVKTFLSGLDTGLAYKSKRLVLAIVHLVLEAAVSRQLIDRNPATGLRSGIEITDTERVEQLEKVRVLTADQVETLLDAIHDAHGQTRYALFVTLARTGLRIGEALALKWDCVDFTTGTITVRRNFSNNQLTSPKTHQLRTVEMSKGLERVLRTRHGLASEPTPNDWVFPNRDGAAALRYAAVLRDTWDTVADKAKAGRITPHILRHTVASTLLAAGKQILDVSKLLGHADPEMTWKVYGHLLPSDNKNMMDVLDGVPQSEVQPSRNLRQFPVKATSAKSKEKKALRSTRKTA